MQDQSQLDQEQSRPSLSERTTRVARLLGFLALSHALIGGAALVASSGSGALGRGLEGLLAGVCIPLLVISIYLAFDPVGRRTSLWAYVRGQTILALLALVLGALYILFGNRGAAIPQTEWRLWLPPWALFLSLSASLIARQILSDRRRELGLRFLEPISFSGLVALADVVIKGAAEVISPQQIARNIDRYFQTFPSEKTWVVGPILIVLEHYPRISRHPRLSKMDPERREAFLRKHFYRDISQRLLRPGVRTLMQAAIRVA